MQDERRPTNFRRSKDFGMAGRTGYAPLTGYAAGRLTVGTWGQLEFQAPNHRCAECLCACFVVADLEIGGKNRPKEHRCRLESVGRSPLSFVLYEF
jgi:hypothetical protein